MKAHDLWTLREHGIKKQTKTLWRYWKRVNFGKLLWTWQEKVEKCLMRSCSKIKNSIMTVMRAKVLKPACVMVERCVCLWAFCSQHVWDWMCPRGVEHVIPSTRRFCKRTQHVSLSWPGPCLSSFFRTSAVHPSLSCLVCSHSVLVCVCVCLPGCDSPPAADHLLTFDQPTPSTKLQQYWYRNAQRIRLQKQDGGDLWPPNQKEQKY